MKPTITLYIREGCHLCEEMLDALTCMQQEYAFQIASVDIDEDGVLREKYNADVPVAIYQNTLLFRHFFNEEAFRLALEDTKST